MPELRSRSSVAALAVACMLAVLAGCATPSGCPQTIEAARTADLGDRTFVGGGYVIRYVPAPHGVARGYDVNITTPISPAGFLDTAFLRVSTEIPGIQNGDPVLLIGPRERGVIVLPGECPPLTVIGEDELD